MIPIDWLFAETQNKKSNGFAEFLTILAEAPHDNIFATDVLLIIIDRFIDRYKYYVLFGNFIPFGIYMVLVLIYMQNYAALPPPEGYPWGNT